MGIVWELFGNCLGIVWEFERELWGVWGEFDGNSLGFYTISKNKVGMRL